MIPVNNSRGSFSTLPTKQKSRAALSNRALTPKWLLAVEYALSIVLIVYGCWEAWWRAFWEIDHSDDEGSMLFSLIHYVRNGGLYGKTFTEYGPFQFYFHRLLHSALQAPLTHEGGRVIMLFCWLSSSVLAGVFLYVLTRRVSLAALSFFLTLALSRVLRHEAGHPQEVILPLIELILCIGLLVGRKATKPSLLILGAIAALICFTKINVGVFSIFALFFTLIAVFPHTRRRRSFLLVSSAGALIFPAILMRAHLHDWAIPYCLVATASIALLVSTLVRVEATDALPARYMLWPVAGFLLAVSSMCGIATSQGTSVAMLWNGLVTLPLRHPAIFFIKLQLAGPALLLAGLCALASGLVWSKRDLLTGRPILLGTFKVAFGLLALFILLTHILVSALVVLPFISLLYLQSRSKAETLGYLFPRLLLSSTLVFQFLQAYPVKGSQVNIALTPAGAWALLLIFDGYKVLQKADIWRSNLLSGLLPKPQIAAAGLMLIGALLVLGANRTDFASPDPGVNISLPGASRIRVLPADAALFPPLIAAIKKDCDVLFTMPGMYSLNIWSGVPSPNGFNVSPWMTALSQEQQLEVLQVLRTSTRPCVAYNRGNLNFWMPMGSGPLNQSPLAQYVLHETSTVARFHDYELRAPIRASSHNLP